MLLTSKVHIWSKLKELYSRNLYLLCVIDNALIREEELSAGLDLSLLTSNCLHTRNKERATNEKTTLSIYQRTSLESAENEKNKSVRVLSSGLDFDLA